jgi:hypothetical protein
LAYNALHGPDPSVTVSDLRLSFDVIARDRGRASEVTAVLSKANRQFRLKMDLLDDQTVVQLQSRHVGQTETYWEAMRDADGSELRRALAPVGLDKAVHLQLQNVDYRLSVWVDGKEIMATSKNSYKPGPASQVRDLAQNRSSKPYVAIGAKDVEVDLLHIKLDRDVYYTSSGKISIQPKERPQADAVSAKIDGDPGHACAEPFQLPLKNHPGPGYFLMGDNSSSSFDSRRWSVKHSGLGEDYVRGTVPRSHMIGQAFSGYWIPALHPKRQLIPRASKVRFIR